MRSTWTAFFMRTTLCFTTHISLLNLCHSLWSTLLLYNQKTDMTFRSIINGQLNNAQWEPDNACKAEHSWPFSPLWESSFQWDVRCHRIIVFFLPRTTHIDWKVTLRCECTLSRNYKNNSCNYQGWPPDGITWQTWWIVPVFNCQHSQGNMLTLLCFSQGPEHLLI